MEPKTKYAFVISYTDCPADVTNEVQDVFVLELTEKEKDELEAKISERFTDAGDGNDSFYTLTVEIACEASGEKLQDHVHGLLDEEPFGEDEEDE